MGIVNYCKQKIGKANALALAATISLSLAAGGVVSHLLDLPETRARSSLESCVNNAEGERKRALFVLQDDERWDDIVLMRQLLSERGYSIEALYPDDVDGETLVGAVREFAKRSDENSKNIFYFSGHGNYINLNNGHIVRGLEMNHYECEEARVMPAFDFLGELAKMKGHTGVIVDSCFSGQFSELAMDAEVRNHLGLKNFVVLASCPFDKKGVKADYEVDGKIKRLGSLTTGLVRALMASRGKEFNLSTEQILCGDEKQRADPVKYAESIGEPAISFELQRMYDCDFKL